MSRGSANLHFFGRGNPDTERIMLCKSKVSAQESVSIFSNANLSNASAKCAELELPDLSLPHLLPALPVAIPTPTQPDLAGATKRSKSTGLLARLATSPINKQVDKLAASAVASPIKHPQINHAPIPRIYQRDLYPSFSDRRAVFTEDISAYPHDEPMLPGLGDLPQKKQQLCIKRHQYVRPITPEVLQALEKPSIAVPNIASAWQHGNCSGTLAAVTKSDRLLLAPPSVANEIDDSMFVNTSDSDLDFHEGVIEIFNESKVDDTDGKAVPSTCWTAAEKGKQRMILGELSDNATNSPERIVQPVTPSKTIISNDASFSSNKRSDMLLSFSSEISRPTSNASWETLDPMYVMSRRRQIQIDDPRTWRYHQCDKFVEFSPVPFDIDKRSLSTTPIYEEDNNDEQLHEHIRYSPSNATSYDLQAMAKEFKATWDQKNNQLRDLMAKFTWKEPHAAMMQDGPRKQKILEQARVNPWPAQLSPKFDPAQEEREFFKYQRLLTLARMEGRLNSPDELHSPVYAEAGITRHLKYSSAVYRDRELGVIISPQPCREFEVVDAIERWETATDPKYDPYFQEERFYGMSGKEYHDCLMQHEMQPMANQLAKLRVRFLAAQRVADQSRQAAEATVKMTERQALRGQIQGLTKTVFRRSVVRRPLHKEILGAGEDPDDFDPDFESPDLRYISQDEIEMDEEKSATFGIADMGLS